MAQALIRNLDEELFAEYKQAARRNGRSLEAELRDALWRARPVVSDRRRELAEEVRAMLPDFVPGPTGSEIIRWYRDTNGGRWSDAFGG